MYDQGFVENEIKEEIKVALINHVQITDVTNVNVTIQDHKALLSFTVVLNDTSFNQEVSV